MNRDVLLRIEDLTVGFGGDERAAPALRGLHLEVAPREALALVGESGSGKSLTALAVMGLLPRSARILGGQILFRGENLLALGPRRMRALRGGRMGIVFQDPLQSLNPYHVVGRQILEAVRLHSGWRGRAARRRVIELLEEVGLDDPERRAQAWPHQLSGGQRQRVMIAMALAGEVELLIADEPTTALDVTVQARILSLFKRVRRKHDMALLLITHDLGVVAEVADRIAVIKEGTIVEERPAREVLRAPEHPYTRELIEAVPRIDAPPATGAPPETAPMNGGKVLEIRSLRVVHETRSGQGRLEAVKGVDLTIPSGKTLALVGESGSGKTTLARAALMLKRPAAGRVMLDPGDGRGPRDLAVLKGRALRALRRHFQAVFQDPHASLSPRRMILDSLVEPLRNFGLVRRREMEDKAVELLELVDLEAGLRHRYPHELSGGQRQRVVLARALAPRPRLIVLDEALSSLDVRLQARAIELLIRLQERFGLAYLFISHDLGVVRRLAHHVAVMRQGHIVETAPNEELFGNPESEYTRELLAAVPRI